MNKKEYLTRFKELTEEMYKTTVKKNSDYTGDESQPFKNFTAVEMMGAATTEQGFFTRMTDKLMRFGSFIRAGTLQVADEKITDTLLDLANYCLLCICYIESKRSKANGLLDRQKEILEDLSTRQTSS